MIFHCLKLPSSRMSRFFPNPVFRNPGVRQNGTNNFTYLAFTSHVVSKQSSRLNPIQINLFIASCNWPWGGGFRGPPSITSKSLMIRPPKLHRIIIYAKKLLNSDWLRKECSSSVQLWLHSPIDGSVRSKQIASFIFRFQISNISP